MKEYFKLKKWDEISNSLELPSNLETELDNDAKLIMIDPYGFMFPYGDISKKPFYYMHHGYIDTIRFNGVTELGDSCLEHQKPGKYHDIMAQPGSKFSKKYERFDDGLKGYEVRCDEPFSQIKYYDDGTLVAKEANILDLTFRPLLYANIDYGNMFPGRFQIQLPCMLTGYYDGIPVMGLGSIDRIYAPSDVFSSHDIMSESAYVYIVGHGIREDGRKEGFMVTLGLYEGRENSVRNGYYWIEGEEPIVTDNAIIEADWVHLPYVDDGTVVYENAIIHIKDKVIHFNGKWGTKGFTKTPRIERHGQSQIFGNWYEGDKPYKQKMFFAWGEHTGAYDSVIKKFGYKVID